MKQPAAPPRDLNVKRKQEIAKDSNLVAPIDLNAGPSRVDIKSQLKNARPNNGVQTIFGFAN